MTGKRPARFDEGEWKRGVSYGATPDRPAQSTWSSLDRSTSITGDSPEITRGVEDPGSHAGISRRPSPGRWVRAVMTPWCVDGFLPSALQRIPGCPSAAERQRQQRADGLAVRLLRARRGSRGWPGPPASSRRSWRCRTSSRGTGRRPRRRAADASATRTKKFPAVTRVQSKGRPSGPGVIGATPVRTCSSGTHTPLERKVMIWRTDRMFR